LKGTLIGKRTPHALPHIFTPYHMAPGVVKMPQGWTPGFLQQKHPRFDQKFRTPDPALGAGVQVGPVGGC